MRFKKLIAISAAGLGVLSATGAAMASGQTSPSKAGTEVTQAADTDNVQEGDQTSPDTAGSESTSESTSETGSETAAESDGPGGHEDPPGTVDHQFDGEE
jgi:hypothetical protein